MSKKDNERMRWWSATRSYYFDSHDADGNEIGLTKEEWKENIRKEYDAKRLNAHHVTFIFHDKDYDVDEHGNVIEKGLHVHVCVYFVHAHTDTAVMQLLGCSRIENVQVIEKNRRSRAYRYLLHVSEGALNEGKHIYSEDELIISKLSDAEKYDYHRYTKVSEEEEAEKEEKDIIKNAVKDIMDGCYDGREQYGAEFYGPLEKILCDEKISRLMGVSPTNDRIIKNAIKTREDKLNAEKLWDKLQSLKKDKE